jgi:hypothetical protein
MSKGKDPHRTRQLLSFPKQKNYCSSIYHFQLENRMFALLRLLKPYDVTL